MQLFMEVDLELVHRLVQQSTPEPLDPQTRVVAVVQVQPVMVGEMVVTEDPAYWLSNI
jgi:hypothetical protein